MNESAQFEVVSAGSNINPLSLGILAFLVLIALALFIAGSVVRVRRGTTQPFGWLVRKLAFLIFMAGFVAYAWEKVYCQLQAPTGPMLDPIQQALWQSRAYAQFGWYMVGACLSMVLGIILGPPRQKDGGSPTRQMEDIVA
jgi:hypothetical protein